MNDVASRNISKIAPLLQRAESRKGMAVLTYGSSMSRDAEAETACHVSPARRRTALLLTLVATAAFLALTSFLGAGNSGNELVMTKQWGESEGNHWAASKLSHLGTWLRTGDDSSAQLQPLPAYNPDDDANTDRLAQPNLDDQGIQLSGSNVKFFSSGLSQKDYHDSDDSVHGGNKNPDVQGLSALRNKVLSKDITKPKERQKKQEKEIFAKAERKEKELKKSLHTQASAKKLQHSAQNIPSSASEYHHGQVRRAEKELTALQKQADRQEASIKRKDEINIEALQMEEKDARKDEEHHLAEIKSNEHKMAKLLESNIQNLKRERAKKHGEDAEQLKAQARLKIKMQKIKEADHERLEALAKKLKALTDKVKPAQTHHKGAVALSGQGSAKQGHVQELVQTVKHSNAQARTVVLSSAQEKKAVVAREKMDAAANKVAKALEKSSKLQQDALFANELLAHELKSQLANAPAVKHAHVKKTVQALKQASSADEKR
jgi:hypothetical protein